ncbi:hypothetical protein GGI25_000631 [Coemansia spiralis]|uniref:Uncharacterized protein n=2 Tax=Coemansia TaxID=4863 RepID=A0A9W8G820_9FUNG|nr:hypothetical protein EDC05_000455 [Coemansia umbellata]KAJ2680657.1 hypothetical protein GGI25_000631 [Coemansia spiralis]
MENWHKYFSLAEFAYNQYKNSSTQFSTFYTNYGSELSVPTAVGADSDGDDKDAADRVRRLKQIVKATQEDITDAQEQAAEYHNVGRAECEFKRDDDVLLSRTVAKPEYLDASKESLGDR